MSHPVTSQFRTHLKRAFDWNLAAINPTPDERQQLDAHGIEPRLHGLYVWRRSTLLVALPVLLLAVVLGFVQAAKTDTSNYTGLGKLFNYLPPIALLFAPLGALVVIRGWLDLRRSSRFLVITWVLSIAVPLLVALMPVDVVMNVSAMRDAFVNQGGDVTVFNQELLAARTIQGLHFATTLLPVILSVPSGVLKGAGRMRSLFPAAVIPGWFLVTVAPFYSLFMIVLFVLVIQIAGNLLLMVGVAIFAFTPWLFVIYRGVYGRPMSMQEAKTELPRVSRAGGYLTATAIVAIVIWLFTARVAGEHVLGSNSNSAIFSYVQVLRTVAEYLSRNLVASVVFSTMFLYVVYAEWRTAREMSPALRAEHDFQVRALEQYMAGPAAQREPGLSRPAMDVV